MNTSIITWITEHNQADQLRTIISQMDSENTKDKIKAGSQWREIYVEYLLNSENPLKTIEAINQIRDFLRGPEE